MQEFLDMLPVLSRMEDSCVEMIDAATKDRNSESLNGIRAAKGQVLKQNTSMVQCESLDIIEWLEGHSLNVLKSLHVDIIIPGEEVLPSRVIQWFVMTESGHELWQTSLNLRWLEVSRLHMLK